MTTELQILICISFRSKSAMRSSSPLSHWKLTMSAPALHRSLRESFCPHIFRILASESTFIPNDVGRSHLKSEKADSRSNNETSATWELSIDCTCKPFSLQSKLMSLQRSFMDPLPSSEARPAAGEPRMPWHTIQ